MKTKISNKKNVCKLAIIAAVMVLLLSAVIVPLASSDSSAAGSRTSTITITLASSSIQIGGNMHASCSLTGMSSSGMKPIAGANVNLAVTLPNGATTYPTQGSQTTTDANGNFSIDYKSTVAGTFKFTATYTGSYVYASKTSSVTYNATAPTTVEAASSMTLTPASSSIAVGSSMQASGTLTGSSAISGATVNVQVTLPDGSTTSPTQGATVTTDSSGKFTMSYTPNKLGTYEFTASFAGNSQYNASSASVSFTATASSTTTSTPTDAKYIITSSGGTYFAKTPSGTTLTTGANAATIINYALSHLTEGRTTKEKVLVQTSATLTSGIKMVSYASLECAPGVVLTASGKFNLLTVSSKSNFEIIGGEWRGAGVTGDLSSNYGPFRFTGTSNNGLIENCVVKWGNYCNIIVDSTSCNHLTFYNVESCECGSPIIRGQYSSTQHSSSGAYGYDSGMGFLIYCSFITLENCHIHDCGWGGCYFYNEGAGINYNVMRNNLVERVGHSGLSISQRIAGGQGDYNVIEGNTLIDCGSDTDHPFINVGFGSGMYGSNNIIRNNMIIDHNTYGTPTDGYGADQGIIVSGNYNQIYGNTIQGLTSRYSQPLAISGTGNQVYSNTIVN